ncbi:aminoglycoside N(3)-acetyltransferase [Tuberibacillus sp. Marseille-P3662]|uniref:aminoglycoside N(3)-acetyltransferase n=1 Tax=Tuberibacillus sp. Marseille-P3662 TaxID=1965358 RepID=UPI003F9260CA
MSEANTVQNADAPRTRDSLANDLRRLGIKEGMTVMVHISMSALGWVCGGPMTVIQALQDVVSVRGNLIIPTHSANVSDPKEWKNPPVPEDWWETIRNEMPAFDPDRTPTYSMGKVPELFRTFPDVKRSNHPVHSFAAWGKDNDWIVSNHSLADGLGEQSPLGKVYDLEGYVLLLGVGYDSNTSLHLAEHRVPEYPTATNGSPIIHNGSRVWQTYSELQYDEDRFPDIGAAYELHHDITLGKVGSATSRLIHQPSIVDFGAETLRKQLKAASNSPN